MTAMHDSLRPRGGRAAPSPGKAPWWPQPLISDAEIAADLFYGRDQDLPLRLPIAGSRRGA